MPCHDFACPACGNQASLSRLFSEFDNVAECPRCGQAMTRLFSPPHPKNVFMPMSFRSVLSDGSPGGGSLSWSDFHSDSPRELARKHPDWVPYAQYMSQPGVGEPHARRDPSPDERPSSVAARETADT